MQWGMSISANSVVVEYDGHIYGFSGDTGEWKHTDLRAVIDAAIKSAEDEAKSERKTEQEADLGSTPSARRFGSARRSVSDNSVMSKRPNNRNQRYRWSVQISARLIGSRWR